MQKHKKIVLCLLAVCCLCAVLQGFAQPASNRNYVVTNVIRQPGITTETQVLAATVTSGHKAQTVQYFDGLGRPMQTVITQGSPNAQDMIAPVEYDALGREVKKYLPFVNMDQYNNYGDYNSNWNQQQANFYNGQLNGVAPDAAPYSQTVLEKSPLNRVLAQGAPGTVWQPNMNDAYDVTKKTVKLKYEINTAADAVKRWTVNLNTTSFAITDITTPGNYNTGELMVKTAIDEHNNTTKEFTDKEGQVVLKRVQDDAGWIDTYYIYDEFNRLRAVIQPEGVAALPAPLNWTFAAKWMFLYRYDERGRLCMKKIPGADSVVMMYDQWDRLVLTQDGNMRAKTNKEFLFTKYDRLNRPIVAGIYINNSTHDVIRNLVTASTGRNEVNNASAEGYTLTQSFPASYQELLSITYYDSYSNITWMGTGYSFTAENNVNSYNNAVKGQLVGTQVKQLGSTNWLRTVTYYDDKYRPIQAITDNVVAGRERVTKKVEFDGTVSDEWITHSSSFYTNAVTTFKKYTYDYAGRVQDVKHRMPGMQEVVLTRQQYNQAGQTLTKELHAAATSEGFGMMALQTLDFGYNIRGWLTNVNRVENTAGVVSYDPSDLFAFELNYNTTAFTGSTAQFNGNISEQKWKGPLAEAARGFAYTYDKVNRLKTSRFSELAGSSWTTPNTKYAEDITLYDKNGNIKSLNRYHNNTQVDQMNYSNYDGNRLLRVDDPMNSVAVGFKNGSNTGDDYVYDVNGNLVTDNNKNISSVTYNYLNLPQQVTVTSKGTIQYTYDASGVKLVKQTTDNTTSPATITKTYYAGLFVYKQVGTGPVEPEIVMHEEGRLRVKKINSAQPLSQTNATYVYDYFMNDHLGNVRMVITAEQQTDVYAATIEPGAAATEDALFNNLQTTTPRRVNKPAQFDADGNNTKVYKLAGTAAEQIGVAKVLKIMAGDKISIQVKSYYNGSAGSVVPNANFVSDLLGLLVGGITGNGGLKGGGNTTTGINNALNIPFGSTIGNRSYSSDRPKAYINYMYLDEDFTIYNSGAEQIPYSDAGTGAQTITISPVANQVQKHGYLYVFLSNESSTDVFFDNLVVNHERGPVLEETHYYAFGTIINNLSTKAIGPTENRYKYNGKELQSKEFSTGEGLEWEDYGARMYDGQLARWMVIDPLAETSRKWSCYNYVYDNPMNYVDPDGMEGTPTQKAIDEWASSHNMSSTDAMHLYVTGGISAIKEDQSSLLKKIIEKTVAIKNGTDRDFKNISYVGKVPNLYNRDINKIANTLVGAYLLAMIETYGVKVKVDDLDMEDFSKMQPGESSNTSWQKGGVLIKYYGGDIFIDKISFTGATILVHELAHAVDIVSMVSKNVNYLRPIDPNNKFYKSDPEITKKFQGNPNRFYFELKAVLVENLFRREAGDNYRRQYYGGIYLGTYINYEEYDGTFLR